MQHFKAGQTHFHFPQSISDSILNLFPSFSWLSACDDHFSLLFPSPTRGERAKRRRAFLILQGNKNSSSHTLFSLIDGVEKEGE